MLRGYVYDVPMPGKSTLKLIVLVSWSSITNRRTVFAEWYLVIWNIRQTAALRSNRKVNLFSAWLFDVFCTVGQIESITNRLHHMKNDEIKVRPIRTAPHSGFNPTQRFAITIYMLIIDAVIELCSDISSNMIGGLHRCEKKN